MVTSLRLRERIRTGIITGLLLLGLVFVGLLTHQTYIAATSQQTLVDDILRDYAAVAADEFVRRQDIIVFYGFGRVLSQLAQIPHTDPLPEPEVLPRIVDIADKDRDELNNATELAEGFFRYDARQGVLEQTGNPTPKIVSDGLIDQLTNTDLTDADWSATFHRRVDGRDHNYIYIKVKSKGDYYVGMRVNDAKVVEWLQFFIDRGPLLPGSLAGGKIPNERVYINLSTLDGTPVYESGTFAEDQPLVVFEGQKDRFKRKLPELYGGLTLKVGIDPAVVDSLVIGGLPVKRLPLLYGGSASLMWTLWILAALMIGTALFFMGRERTLAHLRSDFVSRVSHELRTPLAQIMMFAQTLILDRVRSDDERRRSLQVIDKEARRLSILVDNILRFSRVERGSEAVKLSSQPLFPLVREISDQFRGLMQEGRLILSSDINEDLEVMLDEDAFRQMFVNILDNAVKYSPSGQDVDVSLSVDAGRVDVAVEDRGAGIPASETDRIWEPYYRAPDTRKLAIGGTGIGLAVVRELARLQAAYVSVSERQGGGSRFVIGFDIASGSTA
jgi:signal transduction histidine kinase